jgi:hypothetical protein
MRLVNNDEIQDMLSELANAVILDEDGNTHSVAHGFQAPLSVNRVEKRNLDEMGFCKLVRSRYVTGLLDIIHAASSELQEIATVGRNDGLLNITRQLDRSFTTLEEE